MQLAATTAIVAAAVRVYSAEDVNVVPPLALRQIFPPFPARMVPPGQGVVEVIAQPAEGLAGVKRLARAVEIAVIVRGEMGIARHLPREQPTGQRDARQRSDWALKRVPVPDQHGHLAGRRNGAEQRV